MSSGGNRWDDGILSPCADRSTAVTAATKCLRRALDEPPRRSHRDSANRPWKAQGRGVQTHMPRLWTSASDFRHIHDDNMR